MRPFGACKEPPACDAQGDLKAAEQVRCVFQPHLCRGPEGWVHSEEAVKRGGAVLGSTQDEEGLTEGQGHCPPPAWERESVTDGLSAAAHLPSASTSKAPLPVQASVGGARIYFQFLPPT